MKKLLIAIILLTACGTRARAQYTTVAGGVVNQDGTALQGTARFVLTQTNMPPVTKAYVILNNGLISPAIVLPSTSGTQLYDIQLKDQKGNLVAERYVQVTGAVVDIGNLIEQIPPAPITLWQWPTENVHVVN